MRVLLLNIFFTLFSLVFGVAGVLMVVWPKAWINIQNRGAILGPRPTVKVLAEHPPNRYEEIVVGILLVVMSLVGVLWGVKGSFAAFQSLFSGTIDVLVQPSQDVANQDRSVSWAIILLSVVITSFGIGCVVRPLRTFFFVFSRARYTNEVISSGQLTSSVRLMGILLAAFGVSMFVFQITRAL